MKKKVIAVIIAHPDDEAFGPSGTIAKYAHAGHDVYIICATKGEAGENRKTEDTRKIQHIREEELLASAKILGVKDVFFLGFQDGTLSNNLYHKISESIITILEKLKPDILITLEPRGVSGHIDHIAISMITSFVFEQSKSAKTLMYFCITQAMRRVIPKYFIYFPPGYTKSEINHIEDISIVWKEKMESIRSHKSQLKDVNRMKLLLHLFPKQEHFIVKNKMW